MTKLEQRIWADRRSAGVAYASNTSAPPNAPPQQAGIASNGCKHSSARTAQPAARSTVSSVSSTNWQTATAPPCETSPASAPSPQPPWGAKSATRLDPRCAHKRHLVNRVIRRMRRDEQARNQHLGLAA